MKNMLQEAFLTVKGQELPKYQLKANEIEHMIRVGESSYEFAKYIEFEDIESAYTSGILHDIGKSYISPKILNKPGKLDENEIMQMRYHPFFSAYESIIKGYNTEVAINILFHHENYDGTGYFSLKGENIPLVSRIIKIVDVYDALTNDRPYRKKLGVKKAFKIMDENINEFDFRLYEKFKSYILEKGYEFIISEEA